MIDTGIDYTHSAFGGVGTVEAFEANDPNVIEDGTFPTKKVTGGIDLVGTDFDAGSKVWANRIPKVDADPIDEQGHGSHVAGTIAGIGDNTNTYDGVAPEAELYAIKVFGKDGSTDDSTVIAALEYSMDPNGDLDPSDKLDVVNLSLGSPFGVPYLLYNEAIERLVSKGRVSAIISAGNSGDIPYIVGSPGTTDETISVAASVDNMEHNWKFDAVSINSSENNSIVVKAIESSMTKPLSEIEELSGRFVFIGLADKDLSEDVKNKLNGNVALIDRGAVSFADKLTRAFEAGAIGAVVINNNDGDPIVMGGGKTFDQPSIMISKALGSILKADLEQNYESSIDFKSSVKFEEPQLIDTITGFSSRGPRSVDSKFKPEIAAPGNQILSAAFGKGSKGTKLNGTSMAAPHVAGAVALLKQYFKDVDEDFVKAKILSTAKPMIDAEGKAYPLARQGAGRVQIVEALTSAILVKPATLGLGEIPLHSKKLIRKKVSLENTSDLEKQISVTVDADSGLKIGVVSEVTLLPKTSKEITLDFVVTREGPDTAKELEAKIEFVDLANAENYARLSALGVVKKVTKSLVSDVRVYSQSSTDAEGALIEVDLKNESSESSDALFYNLLAKDDRKQGVGDYARIPGICDLESVGYKITEKEIEGQSVKYFELAAKLYHPITNWNHCEISVQLDEDGDGVADQELLGTDIETLSPGVAAGTFATVLTDAAKLRSIRKAFEIGETELEDYAPAIVSSDEFKGYNHSSIAQMKIPLEVLTTDSFGRLNIKVASIVATNAIVSQDDFLGGQELAWKTLDIQPQDAAFQNIPASITLEANQALTVDLVHGNSEGQLVIYMPYNKSTMSVFNTDKQAFYPTPRYVYGE